MTPLQTTLLIDAGNSRIKWAWRPAQPNQDAQWQVQALSHAQWQQSGLEAQPLLQAVAAAGQVWLCNVAGQQWLQRLPVTRAPYQLVQASAMALGVENSYLVPAQLGSDRWCSVLAAWRLFGRTALVVTAGTALTIDVLAVKPGRVVFMGGTIQPGLRLMWQSLQQGAAQLDYAFPQSVSSPSGLAQDSQQAMWLGCMQALSAAVVMQYERLCQQHEQRPALILTGGDVGLLKQSLPAALAAQVIIVDNLVLKGLACLAEHTDK